MSIFQGLSQGIQAGHGMQMQRQRMDMERRNNMNRARRTEFRGMIKQVQGARKLGIPTSDINALMKAARISEKNRMAILKGQIPEWEMSKRFTQSAQNRAALTAASQQRAQEVKQLMEERRALIRKLMQEYQPAVRLSLTQQLKATQ